MFEAKLEEISSLMIFPECFRGPWKTLRTTCGPQFAHPWLNQTTLYAGFFSHSMRLHDVLEYVSAGLWEYVLIVKV